MCVHYWLSHAPVRTARGGGPRLPPCPLGGGGDAACRLFEGRGVLGVCGEWACPVSACGRWEFMRLFFGGALDFPGGVPAAGFSGVSTLVTPATTVAHAPPGDHASGAWWQVVLRAPLKNWCSRHVSWPVVPHRVACFCCCVEPTTGETCWDCVLLTSAGSLWVCGHTMWWGLQFALDGGVRGLWHFPVPHDRKKVFVCVCVCVCVCEHVLGSPSA